jgi:hypothetical protein
MSTTPSTARTKRSRATAGSGGQSASKRRVRKTATVAPTVSADQRHALIAERAYLRAELRGFQGGDPVQDWLEGEKEVDALLSRSAD